MAEFDRLLIDPSEEELRETVREADRLSWPRERAGPRVEPKALIELSAQMRDRPEGTWLRRFVDVSLARSHRVAVAWWTDPLGRRHLRVHGWFEQASMTFRVCYQRAWDDPSVPPLWHISREQTYLSLCGDRSEAIVCCSCGAAGTPREVAWMGECCGPCHDRREEGESQCDHGFEPAQTVLGVGTDPCTEGAFSPDGRFLGGVRVMLPAMT
jgi:hypothetical protein